MASISEMIKNAARKVTLELVYEVVDERTREIKSEIAGLRTEFKGEIGGLRGEISGLRGEIDGIKGEIKELRQTMDFHYSQINTRIDQLYHLYAEFLRSQRDAR